MEGLNSLYLLLTDLKKEYRLVSKQLSRSPEGKLMIVQDHGRTRYVQVTMKNGVRTLHGISRDQKAIEKLARKRFLEEKCKRLQKNIQLLESVAGKSYSIDAAEILAALPESFLLLDREKLLSGRGGSLPWPCPSRDEDLPFRTPELTTGSLTPEEWGTRPYRENTAFLEDKKHYTSRGIACRSKSEMAILEKYDALHIPYHYDETLRIGMYYLSPDLIGARADGVLIYQEHSGLHDEKYLRRRDRKTDLYDMAGIRLGENLIYTYDREDGSINMELIEAQIRDIYRL